MEEGEVFISIEDEEGNVHDYIYLDSIDLDGVKYAVLADEESEDDSMELVVFEVEEENGETGFVDVESDEIIDKVVEIFINSLEEE